MTRRTVRAVLAVADVVLAPAVVTWLTVSGQLLAAAIITALLAVHVAVVWVAWRRECREAAARYEQAVRAQTRHLTTGWAAADARTWADLEHWGGGAR